MERVAAASATVDLLPLLGASPLTLGRTLVTSKDADGIKGVVIGHELWERSLQRDPRVIGGRLIVNNFDMQVVGV